MNLLWMHYAAQEREAESVDNIIGVSEVEGVHSMGYSRKCGRVMLGRSALQKFQTRSGPLIGFQIYI